MHLLFLVFSLPLVLSCHATGWDRTDCLLDRQPFVSSLIYTSLLSIMLAPLIACHVVLVS